MENFNLTHLIKTAIEAKKELVVKLKSNSTFSSQEVRFYPYIFGADLLNFKFIWGYLPELKTFYSLPLQQIEEAEPNFSTYSPFSFAKYLKPQGEKHFCVLEGVWKYITKES